MKNMKASKSKPNANTPPRDKSLGFELLIHLYELVDGDHTDGGAEESFKTQS